MSKRKYPHWTGISKHHRLIGKPCALCGQADSDRVGTVQINWFRGDDIVAPLHHACITQFVHDERAHVVYQAVLA